MGKEEKYRSGEIDAVYFDELPQRCKELFFEYLYEYEIGNMKSPPSRFVVVHGFNINALCKSPIEQIMDFSFSLAMFEQEYTANTPSLCLIPQEKIIANGKTYYADFYFDSDFLKEDGYLTEKNLKLVIECDGHDFHEKTKEQVKKDNERDYNLKLAGYEVLHYSGSQIFNEPLKCAFEIITYIYSQLKSWKLILED